MSNSQYVIKPREFRKNKSLFILFNMNRRQTIIVEDENILVKSSSFPKTIRSISKSNLVSLLLEEAGAGPSLMFVYQIGKRPDVVPIAPFVNLEGKIYLQKKVATFLKQHNCEFQVVNKTKSIK